MLIEKPKLRQLDSYQTKKKSQRRSLHNNKGVSPMRGYNSLNTYVPDTGIPKYTKQMLTDLKGEIDGNTEIVGDFNTPYPMNEEEYPKYKKNSYNSITRKQFNLKMGRGSDRHFSKDDIQMANKYMKIYPTLLITKEMQIKTTVRYHPILVRMASIEKARDHRSW